MLLPKYSMAEAARLNPSGFRLIDFFLLMIKEI